MVDNDNLLTDSARKALSTADISMQEHVIISDEGFYSYRKAGILM
ncbi:MAG: hypothetical protein IT392_01430 [Nitrospirae bacterium]|nr:hypothetical protein [Nitrospirota bacterium]